MVSIHFKTAFDHIRRSPFQALAAFFVLSITFFVITLLCLLTYSSSQVLKYFETRPQIIAFLKDEASEEDVVNFQKKLENDLRVKKVRFVSKENALEIYKRATADNPLLSELVSPSIFPASVEISLNDLAHAQEVIDEIKNEAFVDQVGFTASLGSEDALSSVVQRLKNISFYIRLGGGVFASILAGTSLLILMVIISLRMTLRRDEIEILSLIGATPSFIRSPIIIEALLYAFAGVFLGWLVAFILVLYSTPLLISYFGEIPVLPRDIFKLSAIFGVVLLIELASGFILATLGSFLAVTRVRRKR
ncbi:hypothetical protein A2892_01495 [Candidatus Woesebacteria bacterium RIFCSPLOWO2_01_FULL_39_10b]|uniref:Cell division protein FtsX n=1 Tax=Candidatus Woesebacteria bacterium RIFCSPLOWO2_01_FULL_39_10b TaxID=1802517 RepID=A0A1F8B9T5_9BACT|nr:MAG: hypothetical protein A2892_01495 [Candidatus Woesebacteria bacterium RIFCSPLOWO2_01_FULL_39_10b]